MSLFGGLFVLRFHLARRLSVDARSGETYSEPEAYRCRQEAGLRTGRTRDGDERLDEARLDTVAAAAPKPGDRLWPPGADPEDESQAREVQSVEAKRAPFSAQVSHYTVRY